MSKHLVDLSKTEAGYNFSIGNAPSIIPGWDVVASVVLHDISKIGDPFGPERYVPNMLKSGKVSDAIPYVTEDKALALPADVVSAHRQARVCLLYTSPSPRD